MPSGLSDLLLHDLHVVDARIILLDLGRDTAVRFPATQHPVLHIVLNGASWLETGDPEQPPIRLKAGDTALILRGDKHCVRVGQKFSETIEIPLVGETTGEQPLLIDAGRPSANVTLMCCFFDLAYVSPAAIAIRALPNLLVMRTTGANEHGRALSGDLGQWRCLLVGPGATAFARALANLHLIHNIRRLFESRWPDPSVEARAPITRGLAAAIQAIHLQPDRRWSVASLAVEVGLSRSRFAAVFTTHIGMPPLAYLTKVRMTHAAQLVQIKSLPLSEIALRCGYREPASFSRSFTAFHGIAPSKFRKGHRVAGKPG